jgi:membrane-bound ClpP family serine protease
MVARAGEGYLLLGKKLYGLLLIILGFVLTASGIYSTSMGLATLGILSLIAGLVLLALKIVRRNEGSQIK